MTENKKKWLGLLCVLIAICGLLAGAELISWFPMSVNDEVIILMIYSLSVFGFLYKALEDIRR